MNQCYNNPDKCNAQNLNSFENKVGIQVASAVDYAKKTPWIGELIKGNPNSLADSSSKANQYVPLKIDEIKNPNGDIIAKKIELVENTEVIFEKGKVYTSDARELGTYDEEGNIKINEDKIVDDKDRLIKSKLDGKTISKECLPPVQSDGKNTEDRFTGKTSKEYK